MPKYETYSSYERAQKKKTIHPIWRGIGFALIILIPILSYAASVVLLDANRANGWVRIPQELILKGWGDPNLAVKFILTVVLSILLYGFFSLITFFLYGSLGPPRYGPYDVPPVQYRGKRYRR
ncbi:MAG: hypothetical protein IT308_13205 [Anaerolineaceae bacterium]|nr:hypothetical protein [Anaerolineaceae bacterium]